jgi:hypothetical protein
MSFKITGKELRESDNYRKWIGGADVVMIRDLYKNEGFSTFIVITKNDDETYDLYRFFKISRESEIVVSADYQGVGANVIFCALFDKHTERKTV